MHDKDSAMTGHDINLVCILQFCQEYPFIKRVTFRLQTIYIICFYEDESVSLKNCSIVDRHIFRSSKQTMLGSKPNPPQIKPTFLLFLLTTYDPATIFRKKVIQMFVRHIYEFQKSFRSIHIMQSSGLSKATSIVFLQKNSFFRCLHLTTDWLKIYLIHALHDIYCRN